MDIFQLGEPAQAWVNLVLVWIGFGTVCGLLAKAIMPGRDPGGAVATLLMGIGGGLIGCGIVSYFAGGAHLRLISPIGLIVATAGAFVILFFYRLLGGYWFVEGDVSLRRQVRKPHHRRRSYVSEYED